MDLLKTQLIKYQIFIFPIVSVLISLVLLGAIVVPQALKIPATNAEIDQNRKTLAIINQKISDLKAVDLGKYETDLNTALVALPADKDIPGILDLVGNYLRLNGMNMTGISFANSSGPDAQTLSSVATGVTTTGARSSLSAFIDSVKDSPRILKVDSLSSSANLNNENLEIQLNLNNYYLQPPKSQNLPPDTPLDKLTQQNFDTLDKIRSAIEKSKALFAVQATGPAVPNVPVGVKTDPFQ